jgi:hypothetical protein
MRVYQERRWAVARSHARDPQPVLESAYQRGEQNLHFWFKRIGNARHLMVTRARFEPPTLRFEEESHPEEDQ